jgi:hypothetical protein
LGLGRHLVHELGLEPDGDTLSRWLAHHFATLIREAEAAPDAAQRRTAEDRAVETILKLWDHRRELPGNAYPLNEYKNAIAALARLRPKSNPWTRLSQNPLQQALSAVFDALSDIVLTGIFLTYENDEASQDSQPSEAFLAEEETRLLAAIKSWVEFFHQSAERQPPRVVIITNEEERAEADTRAAEEAYLEKLEPKDRARQLMISYIEQLEPQLQKLKAELQTTAQSAKTPVAGKKRRQKSQ